MSPALAPPAAELARLRTVLHRARARGIDVRVALLASRGDLGDETALWGKPGAYARVLGGELAAGYGGRVLVVMPSGFGLARAGAASPDAAALAALRVHGGPAGLVDGAVDAVARLAAAAGRPILVPAGPRGSSQSRDRLVIIVVAAVLLAATAARRTRRRGWRTIERAEQQ